MLLMIFQKILMLPDFQIRRPLAVRGSAPEKPGPFRRCLRTRLSKFLTASRLFRRCPRTRLWVLDCTLSLGLQKVTLEAGFLTPFWTWNTWCLAVSQVPQDEALGAWLYIVFRSSESDVRGWVFDAFWDLKYMVFSCFTGAPGRGFGCLTAHRLQVFRKWR